MFQGFSMVFHIFLYHCQAARYQKTNDKSLTAKPELLNVDNPMPKDYSGLVSTHPSSEANLSMDWFKAGTS